MTAWVDAAVVMGSVSAMAVQLWFTSTACSIDGPKPRPPSVRATGASPYRALPSAPEPRIGATHVAFLLDPTGPRPGLSLLAGLLVANALRIDDEGRLRRGPQTPSDLTDVERLALECAPGFRVHAVAQQLSTALRPTLLPEVRGTALWVHAEQRAPLLTSAVALMLAATSAIAAVGFALGTGWSLLGAFLWVAWAALGLERMPIPRGGASSFGTLVLAKLSLQVRAELDSKHWSHYSRHDVAMATALWGIEPYRLRLPRLAEAFDEGHGPQYTFVADLVSTPWSVEAPRLDPPARAEERRASLSAVRRRWLGAAVALTLGTLMCVSVGLQPDGLDLRPLVFATSVTLLSAVLLRFWASRRR
ncbi:MAG: hypothetical protein AAGA54_11895 [Myxococcota bacterium]